MMPVICQVNDNKISAYNFNIRRAGNFGCKEFDFFLIAPKIFTATK